MIDKYCQLDLSLYEEEPVNDYDTISDIYDVIMGVDFCDIIYPIYRKRYFDRIADAKDESLRYLDLGCGTGQFLIRFNEDYFATCCGMDLSEKQIRNAKKNSKDGGNTNFVQGNIVTSEYPGECDIISINFDALNHVTTDSQWDIVFSKVYKALCQNGLFLFDVNSQSRILDDWSIPEIIIKKDIIYIQCGFKPVICDNMVRRKIIMIIYQEAEDRIAKYQAIIEHLALKKERIIEKLKGVGFNSIETIDFSPEDRKKHIFLKNRLFFCCKK